MYLALCTNNRMLIRGYVQHKRNRGGRLRHSAPGTIRTLMRVEDLARAILKGSAPDIIMNTTRHIICCSSLVGRMPALERVDARNVGFGASSSSGDALSGRSLSSCAWRPESSALTALTPPALYSTQRVGVRRNVWFNSRETN